LTDTSTVTRHQLTLRQAIAAANTHGGSNTILFKPGLIGVIDLAGSAALSITSNLTIDGGGIIYVDALDKSRVFDIGTSTVTLSGMVIIDGNAASGNGGAVYSRGPLTIDNCIISSSSAENGGAIYENTAAGAFVLDHCRIAGNTATDTAGGVSISAGGGAQIIHALIEGNVAEGATGAIAASMPAAQKAPVVIKNSVITGNAAQDNGALYLSDMSTRGAGISISGSRLLGNISADGPAGALYVSAATSDHVVIAGSTFASNSADKEGGAVDANGPGPLLIKGSDFESNTAAEYGGGIALEDNLSAVTITGSSVLDNFGGEAGGGIWGTGSFALKISKTTIGGNQTGGLADPMSTGGGIAISTSGATTITGSHFYRNASALGGGGAYFNDSGNISISGTTFGGNTVVGKGGGLDIASGSSTVTIKGDFDANCALTAAGSGGGLYIGGSHKFAITAVFTANVAGAEGGGIFIGGAAAGSIYLSNSIFNNVSAGFGGGVAHPSTATGTVTMKVSAITGNVGARTPQANYSNTYGAFAPIA